LSKINSRRSRQWPQDAEVHAIVITAIRNQPAASVNLSSVGDLIRINTRQTGSR